MREMCEFAPREGTQSFVPALVLDPELACCIFQSLNYILSREYILLDLGSRNLTQIFAPCVRLGLPEIMGGFANEVLYV